jgi:hypothetical protein
LEFAERRRGMNGNNLRERDNPHRRIDRRTLTFCRLIARQIERDETKRVLRKALNRVAEAKRRGVRSPLLADWEIILKNGNWREIRHVLVAEGERETQLRQENPFVGILPEETIRKVYRRYATHLSKRGEAWRKATWKES